MLILYSEKFIPGQLYKLAPRPDFSSFKKENVNLYIKKHSLYQSLFLRKFSYFNSDDKFIGSEFLTANGKTFILYDSQLHYFDFELVLE